jgi:hypothetical protein
MTPIVARSDQSPVCLKASDQSKCGLLCSARVFRILTHRKHTKVIAPVETSDQWIPAMILNPRSEAKQRGINVLAFRDLQQLRGFLIDASKVFQHMERLFE